MIDFLTFKSFISIEVLIVFYYIGAVILPLVVLKLLYWFVNRYEIINITHQKTKEIIYQNLTKEQKIKFILVFVVAFSFLELLWRMIFEFLIAYLQIRDSLVFS
ncbi:MAG: hypothetical protein DRQ51_07990 [Gammaproteobacteria bacterium]|nr:MAG: hypothetical protein DRQ51_07990 [Gammaproteobacteria bacterium]